MMDAGPARPGGRVLKPSKEAQDQAVIRHILDYEQARRVAREREREQQAAREALEMKNHRSVGDLGKCVAAIPAVEYFALCQKYGQEEVTSRGFLKYLQKTHAHLCPNRA